MNERHWNSVKFKQQIKTPQLYAQAQSLYHHILFTEYLTILHERTEHLKDTIPALKMSLWHLGKLSDLSFISSIVKTALGNAHRKNFNDYKIQGNM